MQNQTSHYDGPSCGNDDTNLPTTLYTKDAYPTTTGRSKLSMDPGLQTLLEYI